MAASLPRGDIARDGFVAARSLRPQPRADRLPGDRRGAERRLLRGARQPEHAARDLRGGRRQRRRRDLARQPPPPVRAGLGGDADRDRAVGGRRQLLECLPLDHGQRGALPVRRRRLLPARVPAAAARHRAAGARRTSARVRPGRRLHRRPRGWAGGVVRGHRALGRGASQLHADRRDHRHLPDHGLPAAARRRAAGLRRRPSQHRPSLGDGGVRNGARDRHHLRPHAGGRELHGHLLREHRVLRLLRPAGRRRAVSGGARADRVGQVAVRAADPGANGAADRGAAGDPGHARLRRGPQSQGTCVHWR